MCIIHSNVHYYCTWTANNFRNEKKNGSAASLSLSLRSFQDKNFIAFSKKPCIHLRPVDIMLLNDIALVSNTNAF